MFLSEIIYTLIAKPQVVNYHRRSMKETVPWLFCGSWVSVSLGESSHDSRRPSATDRRLKQMRVSLTTRYQVLGSCAMDLAVEYCRGNGSTCGSCSLEGEMYTQGRNEARVNAPARR